MAPHGLAKPDLSFLGRPRSAKCSTLPLASTKPSNMRYWRRTMKRTAKRTAWTARTTIGLPFGGRVTRTPGDKTTNKRVGRNQGPNICFYLVFFLFLRVRPFLPPTIVPITCVGAPVNVGNCLGLPKKDAAPSTCFWASWTTACACSAAS